MSTHLSTSEHTARKEHRCVWCWEKIERGQRYVRNVSICADAGFCSDAYHPECDEAAERSHKAGDLDYEGFMPGDFKRGKTVAESG